jgi:hypothetical protein
MKALSLACPELGRREPLAMRLPLRYLLSGNSHPGSAKNPGPDLALAEICYGLPLS